MPPSPDEQSLTLVLHQEAAGWAIHRLLLHGAALKPSEEEQEER